MFLVIFIAGLRFHAIAQAVAVKANGLYWLAGGTTNAGIEAAVSNKVTLQLSGSYNPWTFSDGKKMRFWLVEPFPGERRDYASADVIAAEVEPIVTVSGNDITVCAQNLREVKAANLQCMSVHSRQFGASPIEEYTFHAPDGVLIVEVATHTGRHTFNCVCTNIIA